ncbi:MAG: hypothetical protein GSR80_000724 [Desulfurococcales archaeon]|nr:hypothetical protein [Desulfurococcales archaeon]
MVVEGLERILRMCEANEVRGCRRLAELLDSVGRIPEDLLLQVIAGALEDIEAEARARGLDDMAMAAGEARRDVEWALREGGW